MGALKAEIPFTNLYSQAVSLTLDEALLTLRPRSKPRSTPTPTAADSGDVSGSQGAFAEDHRFVRTAGIFVGTLGLPTTRWDTTQ